MVDLKLFSWLAMIALFFGAVRAVAAPSPSPIVAPAAGDVWYSGCQRIVRWQTGCGAPSFELNAELGDSPEPGWIYLSPVAGAPVKLGEQLVTIPGRAIDTPGQAHVRLRCGGATAGISAPFSIASSPPPEAPPAFFLCSEAASGWLFRCDASLSCAGADCSETRFRWIWEKAGAEEEHFEPEAEHSYSKPGRYVVQLTAIDRNCATSRFSREVEIRGPNQLPIADLSLAPDQGGAPLLVLFDGKGSRDPDGRIADWLWDFGDTSPAPKIGETTCAPPPACPNALPDQKKCYLYRSPGTYRVALTVRDDRGGENATQKEVRVEASPPLADFSVNPAEAMAGEPSAFDASASCDPDGQIASYRWNFGDGSPEATGRTVQHVFSGSAPRYRVLLTVTDRSGRSATKSIDYPVQSPVLSPDPYWLCDFPERLLGQHNISGGVQFNRVQWQPEVWINGVRYHHAIGMHPGTLLPYVGWADFSIPRGARYFRALFGLARQDTAPGLGDAAGRIYLDGRLVWEGRAIRNAVQETPAIPIPFGAQVLRFEVDSLGDRWSDHTTWANPRFTTNP